MAVCLLSKDYSTNYCEFSYDNWLNDGDFLPNLNTAGKGVLNTVKSCCQGSIAKGTDGTNKILTGGNIWIPYNLGTGGGGGGGSTPTPDDFIEL